MKVIVITACLVGLMSGASAQDLRAQVRASNDALDKAMLKKDIAVFASAMRSNVAPGFQYYDTPTSKPETLDQMLAGMKMGFAAMGDVKASQTRLLTIKPGPGIQTVSQSHHLICGTVDAKKHRHTMSFSGISIEVYKKIGNAWKSTSFTWKIQDTRLDGHPLKG